MAPMAGKKQVAVPAAENAWASEAMSAFRNPELDRLARAKADAARERKAARANAKPWQTKRRAASAIRSKALARKAEEAEEWVFVQRAGEPVQVSPERRNVMVLPPGFAIERELRGAPGQPSVAVRIPVVTREMPDTKFNRVFKRPLPHNYGRCNTRPVNDANYLKSFNVHAGDADPTQVFESSARAKAFHETLREHNYNIQECMDAEAAQTSAFEANPANQVDAPQVASNAMGPGPDGDDSGPSSPEVSVYTFGMPTKPRHSEPSMFEILSWPDPEYPVAPTAGA